MLAGLRMLSICNWKTACIRTGMMGLDQYSAVIKTAGRYNVPVIMDADLGHLPPAMPVISGAYAEVSVKDDNIHFSYELK